MAPDATEFSDAELIEFNRKINKLLKNIRDAEFTKFKKLRSNVSSDEIYAEIDRVDKGDAPQYPFTLYKNSDEYTELWNKLIAHLTTPIGDALSSLRRSNKARLTYIQNAARLPEVGGGRTKRSRKTRKQRKTKRRARR